MWGHSPSKARTEVPTAERLQVRGTWLEENVGVSRDSRWQEGSTPCVGKRRRPLLEGGGAGGQLA